MRRAINNFCIYKIIDKHLFVTCIIAVSSGDNNNDRIIVMIVRIVLFWDKEALY